MPRDGKDEETNITNNIVHDIVDEQVHGEQVVDQGEVDTTRIKSSKVVKSLGQ